MHEFKTKIRNTEKKGGNCIAIAWASEPQKIKIAPTIGTEYAPKEKKSQLMELCSRAGVLVFLF